MAKPPQQSHYPLLLDKEYHALPQYMRPAESIFPERPKGMAKHQRQDWRDSFLVIAQFWQNQHQK